MKTDRTIVRAKPARVTGVAHVFAATGYSISGIRRLWQEAAFRHILLMLPVCLVVLVACKVGMVEYAVFAVLFFFLVATEALNTAIECIVDHLAPNWEEFARDAKDLGSLATMCMLFATGIFLAAVILRVLL